MISEKRTPRRSETDRHSFAARRLALCVDAPPGAAGQVPKHAQTQNIDEPVVLARRDGTVVVGCSGELDLAARVELEHRLQTATATDPEMVVVDLTHVTFFDAATFGVCVATRTALRAAGGDLALRSPSTFGRRVLTIVGLDDLTEGPGSPTAPIVSTDLAESPSGQIGAQSRLEVKIDEATGLIAEQFGLTIAASTSALGNFDQLCDQSVGIVATDLIDGTRTIAEVRSSVPDGLLGPAVAGTAVAEGS